eukprot:3747776-Amphidinium_carterae.2
MQQIPMRLGRPPGQPEAPLGRPHNTSKCRHLREWTTMGLAIQTGANLAEVGASRDTDAQKPSKKLHHVRYCSKKAARWESMRNNLSRTFTKRVAECPGSSSQRAAPASHAHLEHITAMRASCSWWCSWEHSRMWIYLMTQSHALDSISNDQLSICNRGLL